ncbi:dihydrolipoamide acetyltransferase, partial [Halomonas campaniensis]
MSSEIIKVPDIGGDTDVEIIEIAVSVGDVIEAEDTLITLESDKASMDVPAPKGGKVLKVLVKEGDSVSEGDDIVELEVEGGGDEEQESSSDSQSEKAPAKQDKPKEPSQEQKPAAKKAAGGKQTVDITVPDLGGSDSVEIIEVAVSEGDEVEAEDTLITLESDKASMDVPSPHSGKIVSFTVKEGDTVSEGDVIGKMEIAGEGGDDSEEAPQESASSQQSSSQASSEPEESVGEDDQEEAASGEPERKEIRVPDLSGSSDVPIIEIGVAAGDEVNEEDPLITLESDKASMDVPSPYKGKLLELTVKEGDTVSEGDVIGYMEVAGAKKAAPKKAAPEKASQSSDSKDSAKPSESPAGTPSPEAQMAAHKPRDGKLVHAGPAVRMLARELGVDLGLVKPSGPKDRVLKEDVQSYVKQAIANQGKAQPGAAAAATGGAGIPPIP